MAQTKFMETVVKMNFQTGMKENGESIYSSKSLRNIKDAATSEEIMQVAGALASLVSYPLESVVKNDSFNLSK
ncbi:DUF1659 domain-containing protein [Niallia sp. NCCP-28]|uniref:DUF1659 domain-containing protein n=1 Tax=Niallia sp. NCCP-28 TaxID=2934712 RepID=UPI00208298BF|nr:DUF1659 domain-containing protein [Niallia sp. NCCP-28]GKU82761.1 hypothetical protein NCCP28_21570 [Niallia sp. NCCP-28]